MKEMQHKFIDLFFNPNEEICVSHNKYAYHSVTQESLERETIELVSPNSSIQVSTIEPSEINLLTINPCSGFRNDQNITKFRSFLVELDTGTLHSQAKYVNEMGMPYSVSVFSGNKSLHYGIVLEDDLLTIDSWRHINQWILNIMKQADQQTKNPSRNIRFPENIRNETGLEQKLIYLGKRISQVELFMWLNKHPDKRPSIIVPKLRNPSPIVGDIPEWVKKKLREGITEERNKNWFIISMIFAENGFTKEETTDILMDNFEEQADFKTKELLFCIDSAFKRKISVGFY